MGKIKILAIDGLDCSGKSTFVDKLYKYLLEDKLNPNLKVYKYHLPDYTNESGKKIKEIFSKSNTKISRKLAREIIDLNSLNKREWWNSHWDKWNKNENTLLIMDRYILSNHLYNIPWLGNIEESSEYINMIDNEKYMLPKPNGQIFFACDFELQKKRLSSRKNKDLYENLKLLEIINQNAYKIFKINAPKRNMILPAQLLDAEYLQDKQLSTMIDLAEGMEQMFIFKTMTLINSLYSKEGIKFNKPKMNLLLNTLINEYTEDYKALYGGDEN